MNMRKKNAVGNPDSTESTRNSGLGERFPGCTGGSGVAGRGSFRDDIEGSYPCEFAVTL
jgi:hypothetical protein